VTTTCKVDVPDADTQELAALPPAPRAGGGGAAAAAAAAARGADGLAAAPLGGVVSSLPILPAAEAFAGACAPEREAGGGARGGAPAAPAAALALRVAGTRGGEGASRVALRVRPIEGMPGELHALVVSEPAPRTAIAVRVSGRARKGAHAGGRAGRRA